MSLRTCWLLLGFNLLIILLVIHVYIYSEKSLDTMKHVCINSIAYLCNFILLFLPFSYIYLYNFFYKTTLCKNSAWFSAKESKLSSGLSQTPYNGFVIHLKKTNILRVSHKQCINTSLLQAPLSLKQFRLTCSKLLEKNLLNTYIFLKYQPDQQWKTIRLEFVSSSSLIWVQTFVLFGIIIFLSQNIQIIEQCWANVRHI